MNLLSKDQILAATDSGRELFPVPEWGGDVFINVMSGTERDAFEQAVVGDGEHRNWRNVRARLAVIVLVDEEGKRLFADTDVAALGRKSSIVLDRIFDAAQRVNALRPEDIKELAKNSGGAPSGASTSG